MRRSSFLLGPAVASLIVLIPSGNPAAQDCQTIDQSCEHLPGGITCSNIEVYEMLQSFTPARPWLCSVELFLSVGWPGEDTPVTLQ